MMILSLWCLLFCHMWFEEDMVPALVLLLLWLALPLWDERILELTGFLQDWSQWEHQRAYTKYILLFCWWWAVQLGKGHFNINLDVFSGIQIINENSLKQKSDFFFKGESILGDRKGERYHVSLKCIFDHYNWTFLLLHCFSDAKCLCTSPQEHFPGWWWSSGGTELSSAVPENPSSPSTSFKLSAILTALTI